MKQKYNELFENSINAHWSYKALTNYHSNTMTYGEIGEKIMRFHKLFESNGILPGDKIALIGKSCINWGIVYLSATTYGAVIVPILSEFPADDIHYIVNHSDAKVFFCSKQIYAGLDLAEMKAIQALILLDDFSVEYNPQNITIALEDKPLVEASKLKLPRFEEDSLVAILYTSGTSGFSKGVMLQRKALVANILYALPNMPLVKGDNIVSFLPIAHAYGCAFEFLYPFVAGCNITFFGKMPTPQLILAAFGEIKPRLILSVPLIIEKIIRKKVYPELEKNPAKLLLKIPLLRQIVYKKIKASLFQSFGGKMKEYVIGGAALDPAIEKFLRDIKFPFAVGYGMTECGPLITYAGFAISKSGSAGRAIDYIDIKTINKNKEGLGEFVLKGENVMTGYFKNKEATASAFTEDGWMKTGDLGYVDADGYIFIKGRSKSMILGANGKNIFPEEIEAKINDIPCIQESLVVERNGKLCALIRPEVGCVDAEGVKITEQIDEKQIEINKRLPKHMQIAKIEVLETDFEKTPKQSIKRYKYQG